MTDLPFAEFRHRVLVSRERVKFADADPYGHLASGAYLDMIMSHRVEVLDDLVGFSIMRYASSGVAFPARHVELTYLRPAFVGETLELASWIESLSTSSFEVRAVVAGASDRKARTLAKVHFVTVDSRSGKPVPVPEALPSVATSNPLDTLPVLASYLETVTGVPEGWVSSQRAMSPA